MSAGITLVRRRILLLLVAVVVSFAIILLLITPVISNLSPEDTRQERLNYILGLPLLTFGLLALCYRYLQPISVLTHALKEGKEISPEIAQQARTRAFSFPIYALYIPTIATFLLSTMMDVLGAVFVETYSFQKHFPSTILITVASTSGSLIISLISRRFLTPVLLVTSGLAENIGPRFNIRIRQFIITLTLIFIAIIFLGLLSYNQIVRNGREGLRKQYTLLGEHIANDLGVYLSNRDMVTYINMFLMEEDGYAFIIDEQGNAMTQFPVDYPDLEFENYQAMLAERDSGVIEVPHGEFVLIPLKRPSVDWRLGFAYRMDPFKIPVVRQMLLIQLVFIAGMLVFVFVTSRYIADDLTRDIEYVTERLQILTQDQTEFDFEKVGVLSLDEVGDLVEALNELQTRVLRQIKEQASLYTASAALTSSLDIESTLLTCAQQLTDVLGVEGCAISDWDEASDRIIIRVDYAIPGSMENWDDADEPGTVYDLKAYPATRQVLQSTKPMTVHVSDATADPQERALLEEMGLLSLLMIPLTIKGHSIGLIELVDGREERKFAAEEIQLIQAMAQQMATAIENARLFQRAQDRAREMTLLHEVSQHISTLLDIDILLNELVEQVARVFDYQVISIHLIDETTKKLELAAQQGLDDAFVLGKHQKVGGKGIVPWVAKTGQPLLVPDVSKDERYMEGSKGARSELAIPLQVGDRIIGVLNLESDEVNHFDEDDLRLMTALANQTAVAIQNARLFQSVRSQATHLELLQSVSQKISSILDIQRLLNEIIDAVATTFGYEHIGIFLMDEPAQELYLGAAVGYPDSVSGLRINVAGGKGIVTSAVTTRMPVLVNDVTQDPRYIEGLPSVRSELAVPLIVGGRVIGVFNLESDQANAFGGEDIRLMTALAYQIAVALNNAHLFENVRGQALELTQLAGDLREEKTKLDAILQNVAAGLLVTDSQGMILLVNPAFEEMFDHPAEELTGHALKSVVAEMELHRLTTSALQDPEDTFVADIPLRDGRAIKASSAAIQERNRVIGVVTALRDVTHEKEVDRMKTEFISTVSHELRTPLTSVLGFTKLIRRSFDRTIIPALPGKGKVKKAVTRIEDNLGIIISESERLTRLINDVLDIAKMEAGRIEWQLEPVSVDEMVCSAMSTISALAQNKGLEVIAEICENLPVVEADRDRLVQVVTNLLSNAIKFTDKGEIYLAAGRLLDGQLVDERLMDWEAVTHFPVSQLTGQWVMVSVRDTGVGIAEQDLGQVFEKFKQVGDILTDRPKGTGLGLSICKEIVEYHGGHIWVESELGQGSTFIFVLPLGGSGEDAGLDQLDLPVAPLSVEGDGQLILVADDEENIRNLLRQELSEVGYRVIEAADGAEALYKARQERPNLIILDVMMPGISGFDVTSALKADQDTAGIPILILSIVEDREKGLQLGADEYLTKPLDAERLLRSVAVLLARGSQGDEA